jgi:hypothetical protein
MHLQLVLRQDGQPGAVLAVGHTADPRPSDVRMHRKLEAVFQYGRDTDAGGPAWARAGGSTAR